MTADVEGSGLGVFQESSSILSPSESDIDLATEPLSEDLEQCSASNSGSNLGMGEGNRRKKDDGVVGMLARLEILL